jgi:hypothetical protein
MIAKKPKMLHPSLSTILSSLLLLLTWNPTTTPFFFARATPITTATTSKTANPTVTLKNGTYEGIHSDSYNQDFFLGIPFAQPPLGNLRLNLPASLNTSWKGVKKATEYYPECVGYGVSIELPIGKRISKESLYVRDNFLE